MSKTYAVNEVFFSLQGEGIRAGTPNVFIRMQGCNMRCDMEEGPLSPGGFKCDTEFASGRKVSLDELAHWAATSVEIALSREGKTIYGDGLCSGYDFWPEPYLILTGGEPGLQVDKEFCDYWHQRGVKLAIETNGSIEMPYDTVGQGVSQGFGGSKVISDNKQYLLDWITVSPKVAEHAIKQPFAHEIKYVRGFGQAVPKPATKALYYLISPAFEGGKLDPRTLQWCIKLCLEHPKWRLSCQLHHQWAVR